MTSYLFIPLHPACTSEANQIVASSDTAGLRPHKVAHEPPRRSPWPMKGTVETPGCRPVQSLRRCSREWKPPPGVSGPVARSPGKAPLTGDLVNCRNQLAGLLPGLDLLEPLNTCHCPVFYPGTWNLEPGTRNLNLIRTWNVELGLTSLWHYVILGARFRR